MKYLTQILLQLVIQNFKYIENNFNILAGSDFENFYTSYKKTINQKYNFDINLYRNSTASEKIVKLLLT